MARVLRAGLLLLAALVVLPPLVYAFVPDDPPALPAPGRSVEVVPGRSVNLIEAGSGPPVVLVHGLPGSAYDWRGVVDALAARGRRALAYDRVGYGHSSGRDGGVASVDANADELLGLLAVEDLTDAVVVGWSYGGATAIAAAKRDPSRMRALVLVGSVGPGFEDEPRPSGFVMTWVARPILHWILRVPPLSRGLLEGMLATGFAPEPSDPAYLELVSANFAAPNTLGTFTAEGFDLDGRLDFDPADLDLPILVAHGDGDRLVPPRVGRALHDRAKRGELWLVENAGHMLPLTRPDELAERIAGL